MDTMIQHAQAKPVPPSQRTELPIPETLDRVILACLEKNPDHRPATADALAEQLAAIEAAMPWTQQSAHAWWDAHRPAPVE